MNRDITDKAIRRRDTRLWVALIKLSRIGGTTVFYRNFLRWSILFRHFRCGRGSAIQCLRDFNLAHDKSLKLDVKWS